MKLRERVGKLEQRTAASIGDEGGCWPILMVELNDGDDEAAVIAAAYERAGQPKPVTGGKGGGPIRMVIVDLRNSRSDQTEVQDNEN